MPFQSTRSQGAGSLQLPLRIWGTGGRGGWGTSVIRPACRAMTCLSYQPSPPAGFGGLVRAMQSPRAWPCIAQGPVFYGTQRGGSHGGKSRKPQKKSDWISPANLFQNSYPRASFASSLLFLEPRTTQALGSVLLLRRGWYLPMSISISPCAEMPRRLQACGCPANIHNGLSSFPWFLMTFSKQGIVVLPLLRGRAITML